MDKGIVLASVMLREKVGGWEWRFVCVCILLGLEIL
jgi:hypothetical protein